MEDRKIFRGFPESPGIQFYLYRGYFSLNVIATVCYPPGRIRQPTKSKTRRAVFPGAKFSRFQSGTGGRNLVARAKHLLGDERERKDADDRVKNARARNHEPLTLEN